MSKFTRFLGGPNWPKTCVRGTKFSFKDWAPGSHQTSLINGTERVSELGSHWQALPTIQLGSDKKYPSYIIHRAISLYLWKAKRPIDPTSTKTFKTVSPWSCSASRCENVELKNASRFRWLATLVPSSVEMSSRSGCCFLTARTMSSTWDNVKEWPAVPIPTESAIYWVSNARVHFYIKKSKAN